MCIITIEMSSALQLFTLIVSIFHLFINEIESSPVIDKEFNYLDNCPRIVSREEWKARNATSSYTELSYVPTPYIVVHHGGLPDECYDETGCAEIVRSYQDLHLDNRSWIDIGYNFVIGKDGNVYHGRGWDYVGAHAPGYNTQSIGISITGDFSHSLPPDSALIALESLIACGVELGKVSTEYQVIGHRQARDTACPGDTFYKWVQDMPNWTDQPIPIYQNSSQSSSSQSSQSSSSSSSSNGTYRAKI